MGRYGEVVNASRRAAVDSSDWQCHREVAWLPAELLGNASRRKQVNFGVTQRWVIQKRHLVWPQWGCRMQRPYPQWVHRD